jgi:hypothetical protein
MSQWSPCKRREFIRRLREIGFDGLFSGTRHQFMVYQQRRLAIPSIAEYSGLRPQSLVVTLNEPIR